ncbi:MAG TPA: HAMP domain-containing sensor histidine kinase, partial [Anaerolineales bacterium]
NDYMSRLVNELLTLARMDAGQAMLKNEELDLSDLTLEVVERLAPLANRSGVELATGELPELPIRGDRQYLIQMLTNLVENAIKYSTGPLKHVRVEVGRSMASSQEMGWVKVTDTGPGIPAEDIPHIFDRFYRVDKARSRNPQDGPNDVPEEERPTGSGLGLSIAQWIARAHGGEIRVSSELGKGTTFEVNLPLEEIEASSNSQPEL